MAQQRRKMVKQRFRVKKPLMVNILDNHHNAKKLHSYDIMHILNKKACIYTCTSLTSHFHLQISICKMCRSERNSIVRNRECDFMVVAINPEADHDTVIEKAASILGLNPAIRSLVHLSRSKKTQRNIIETGTSYRWSIGEGI